MGEVPETGVCELRLGNRAWKEFRVLLWRKCSIGAGLRMLPLGSAVYATLLNWFRMGCGSLRASSLVLAIFCAGFLALASCGGGGGGTPTPGGGGTPTPGGGGTPTPGGGGTPTPGGGGGPAPAATAFESYPEYSGLPGGTENWALDKTGVSDAYAHIADQLNLSQASDLVPGEGITIAIIDSGVDQDHWEFAGAALTETIIPSGSMIEDGDGDEQGTGTGLSHGTAVASIILAQRGSMDGPLDDGTAGYNFHGIAYGASVNFFSAPPLYVGTVESARGPGPPIFNYGPALLPSVERGIRRTDGWIGRVLAAEPDTQIISISFGVRGLVELYLDEMGEEDEVRRALQDEIAVLTQGGDRATDKTLIVIAAGNENGLQCSSLTQGLDMLCETAGGGTQGSLVAASPSIDAALQVFFPELRGHVVTAVSIQNNEDGTIAGTSNRCGIAAAWCIAAPGDGVLTAWFVPGGPGETPRRGYKELSGTSFAAPHVAGGLALLMQFFSDQMTHEEILQRLYETAKKTGEYAPDPVAAGDECPGHLNDPTTDLAACELSSTYGQGLMDLDSATTMLPPITMALGDTLDDRRVPAASSGLRGGAAFGHALVAGLRGYRIAVFDRLDAPFQVDLDRFAPPAAMPSISSRLGRFLEPDTEFHEAGGSVRAAIKPGAVGGLVDLPFASTRLRVGINHPGWEGPDSAWATGHASLVPLSDGGASLTLGDSALQFSTFLTPSKFADAEQVPPTAGAMLSWKPADGPLDFRVAALREFGNSLGMEASGAFGGFASNLAFAGVGLRAEAGGWEWSAAAEFGHSTPKVSPGSVQEISGLSSSAFSVSGERGFQEGGRLGLSAAWPLRAEHGRLRLKVASGRDKRRNVQYESVSTSLVPSGRQVDLGVNWRQPLGVEGGELRLGAVLSLEPGHETGRSPELALMAGYRLSF